MPDRWVTLGGVSFKVDPGVEVNRVILLHGPNWNEGSVLSVHTDDDSTAYQNTTGKTAYVVLVLKTTNTGTERRHVKIFSGPTVDSITSATLLWEIGKTTGTNVFNGGGDTVSTPTLRIQNNHYVTVQNVDDGRTGINEFELNRDRLHYVIELT